MSWKQANITPIYKNKGSKNDANNYRPVSLTSIVCKLFEKIIRDEVMKHLSTHSLISVHQYGFMEGRSCITNLLETMDDWSKVADKKKEINCIFLDFKKAFDSVPHERLLLKVKSYGISGKILGWLRSFLSGRIQRVVVNGALSSNENVISGVPQGSVLGPLLFIIYINDLPDSIKSSVKIFADDTKVYRKIDDISDMHILQEDLNSLQKWAHTWQMNFHPQKCKVLKINKGAEFSYKMVDKGEDIMLDEVKIEKDLGVQIDSELSFNEQCSSAINRARKIAIIIRRTFVSIDESMIKPLYTALIRSRLEYGIEVWSPRFKKDSKAIESVQRMVTRMVPSLKELEYGDRLRKLKLPSLKY